MSEVNPFIYPSFSDYKRDVDPIKHYIEQQSFYLSKMTGKSHEVAYNWLLDEMKNPESPFVLKDPTVRYLSREHQRDRVPMTTTLSQYISSTVQNEELLMPTFTVYLPKKKKVSLYSDWIVDKKKDRKHHKKLMFKAEMEGDKVKAAQENNNQQKKKIGINSLSGATVNQYTMNYVASTHSSLTSMCRISTSYANANNEKFLGGNRQYHSEKITLDNLVFLTMTAKRDLIKQTIDSYGIVYPTVEQTVECVRRSTDKYWSKNTALKSVGDYINTLDEIERANIVYNGDLYHLAKFNESIVRDFINDTIKIEVEEIPNPEYWLEEVSDDHTSSYTALMCSELLKGVQLGKVKETDPATYSKVASMTKKTFDNLKKHQMFIECFLRPDYLTPSIYSIEAVVREVVVTSDTDSTIFTSQFWTKFITGSYNFDLLSYKTAYFMTFISSRMTEHLLLMMSANIGFEQSHLDAIKMKSEYFFPVYSISPSAKHYFAHISAREGNIYDKLKLETKGVGFKNSNIPAKAMEPFEQQLINTLNTVRETNEISIYDILEPAVKVEKMVLDSLSGGGTEFLTTKQLKRPDSYKRGEEDANYQYHLAYNFIFGDKYGHSPELPYVGIKVSTTLNNKTSINKWIETIEDPSISSKVQEWVVRSGKFDMSTFYIPLMVFSQSPMPQELMRIVDMRKIAVGITAPWYLYLEAMGFYLKNKHNTKLIAEVYADLVNGKKDVTEVTPV